MLGDMLLDVVNYLQSRGVVAGDGVDTYRDFTPDKPDKVVVLQEYPGLGTIQGSEGAQRNFQVAVRSAVDDPDWARLKAWEIFNVLDLPGRIIDEGGFWGVLSGRQTPNKLRVDDNNRVVYGFNMNIVTQRD